MPHDRHVAFIEGSVGVRNVFQLPFERMWAIGKSEDLQGKYSRCCDTPVSLPFGACHSRHTWVEEGRNLLAVLFTLLK